MQIIRSTPKETPWSGKRTVRATIYGNTHGYIAGRFWRTIGMTYAPGTDENVAAFLRGDID